MEDQPRVLSVEQYNHLLNYLMNQPYKQVAGAIEELKNIPTVEQFTAKDDPKLDEDLSDTI